MLAELERAYASGLLRITYEGKTLEYRNLADMERAIITVRNSINRAAGKRKSRRVQMRSKRGL
jgi:hypothetical protein